MGNISKTFFGGNKIILLILAILSYAVIGALIGWFVKFRREWLIKNKNIKEAASKEK